MLVYKIVTCESNAGVLKASAAIALLRQCLDSDSRHAHLLEHAQHQAPIGIFFEMSRQPASSPVVRKRESHSSSFAGTSSAGGNATSNVSPQLGQFTVTVSIAGISDKLERSNQASNSSPTPECAPRRPGDAFLPYPHLPHARPLFKPRQPLPDCQYQLSGEDAGVLFLSGCEPDQTILQSNRFAELPAQQFQFSYLLASLVR